ncbi:Nesprin-1 Enaptin KASH domain-containing protein 1 [Larimichthys crocea]|uniref:Nesprin-1 Enaptin KASH domain-containing protein 1 n=1 Tax=Larimichthys crocea TaxID=215358 RepID=A0A6G0IUB7_LARCR|nr:Nesprin-1 Enaptin KASH domain-containing protein 1 [Larimichthys crocea]
MLTRLFQGAMKARLLASARECGQRWDDVNGKLETITGRLKLFVSEWEGFEAEREELALWLADLDVRLTEVDHLTGNTCEKLRRLQVFEDDWILSQATDSGCPSESLLEDEGALDKANLDVPATLPSPVRLPPPSPSSPTHEHLGLEWDPSVDIGRSVSRDDADSSYFSASTGLCHRDGLKRRSYLSSLGSQSDISQEADQRLSGWFDHAHPAVFSPVETKGGGTWLNGDQWTTSTPDREDSEPVSFDGGRVRAWLGGQSPAPLEKRTSCSKAVQTDGQVKLHLEGSYMDTSNSQRRHDNTQQPFPAPSPAPSHDVKPLSDWMKHQYRSNLQDEEEQSCWEEAECLLSEQSVTSSSRTPSSLLSPALLYLLLAAALVLLACLIWVALEPPCHRSSRMPRGFHLTLRYVNGPPPT